MLMLTYLLFYYFNLSSCFYLVVSHLKLPLGEMGGIELNKLIILAFIAMAGLELAVFGFLA